MLYSNITDISKFQITKEALNTFVCGTVISNLSQIDQILHYEGMKTQENLEEKKT